MTLVRLCSSSKRTSRSERTRLYLKGQGRRSVMRPGANGGRAALPNVGGSRVYGLAGGFGALAHVGTRDQA